MKKRSKLVNIIIGFLLVVSSYFALAATGGTPTADADAGYDQKVDVNTEVHFDGSGSSSVGDLEYTWYLRDGNVITVDFPNPVHTYTKEGVYEVGLMVKDENGYFDLDTVQITVKNYLPTADAGSDLVVDEDEVVDFDGSASSDANNDIVSHEWDYGDGTGTTGVTGSNVYEDAGTYYAVLTVTDNDGAYDKDMIVVTINNVEPTADAIADGEVDDDLTVIEDELVVFDASSSTDTPSDMPTLKYSWNFGDGSMGYGISTEHTYTKQGIYTATLTVTDDNDEQTQDEITVNVENADPSAVAGQYHIDEGSSLFFDASGSYDTDSDDPLLDYSWDYETDGTSDDIGWYSQHTYWDDGSPTTTLDVEDDDSSLKSDSQDITVNNVDPMPSIFDWAVYDYTIVDFGLRIAGEKWHDVTLNLYEEDTEIGDIYLYRSPGSPNDQMDFIYGIEIDRFTSYSAEIVYTPENDPVNGQVYGASPCWLILYLEDGREFRFHRVFNYNKPHEWTWNIDLSSIVKVSFDAELYDPGMDTVTFGWDFADGSSIVEHTYATSGSYPTKVTDSVVHVYILPGIYSIKLNGLDDDGGLGIYSLDLNNKPDTVTIDNLAPRAYADVDIISTMEDEVFQFSGSGTDLLNDGLIYNWNLDDGSSQSGGIIMHSYSDEGIYLVTLTVTDSLGASAKDFIFVTVTNVDPVAECGGNMGSDEDELVNFDASMSTDTLSDIPLLSYAWDYGDGSKGYGISSSHVYTMYGIYEVTLTVQDNNGAISTDILTVTVRNPAPLDLDIVAKQDADEDELIQFTATAVDTPSDEPLLTYVWAFGDSAVGYGRNPTHSYTYPGEYQVKLTVTDDDLDSDDSYTEIIVVNVDPVALVGATQLELYGPAVTLEFEARGFDTYSDQSSLVYKWYLGGGVYKYAQTISKDFSHTGTFSISLRVYDPHLSSTGTIQILIHVILDSDGDMLTDEDETKLGTDPLLWDTDSDNLLDYWEEVDFGTDPLAYDTDYDGLDDWHEYTFLGLSDIDEDGLINPCDWDSDGEWIMDGIDPHPTIYDDTDGSLLYWDAISVRNDIGYGVSVVMYGGTTSIKPQLSHATPPAPLAGGINIYVRIESTAPTPFTAQIRMKYNELLLPSNVNEGRLGIYYWSSADNQWKITEETDVDTANDFVWAKVSKFSVFGIGDSGLVDSDVDGLSNWYETNTHYDSKFEYSKGTTTKYSRGKPLYLKNNRIQYQIPSSHIKWKKIMAYDLAYGTVDLFSLGFNKNDFATANTWRLTNGGSRVYISLSTAKVINPASASLTFELLKWMMGSNNYMRIDVRGTTDPYDPDTDGDGLWDGDEVMTYKTNPLDDDTDDDRLGDGDEVNKYRTNPKDSDTDDDGVKDSSDYDPLVDLKITVYVKEILEIDRADYWPAGVRNSGDFYIKVSINGAEYKSKTYGGMGHGYPNYVVTRDVPDYKKNVDIVIELFDDDPWPNPDDTADISRWGKGVNLNYDVRTGMWSGEDSIGDRNGYGHASGTEDGSHKSTAEGIDCDIWFDIRQNEYDDDVLAYWKEVHSLGTDPKFTNGDSDGDGMGDWFEVRYGFNRLDPSDALNDPDGDHLTNIQEHRLGTDPLFFEINLMASLNWDASESYMNKLAKGFRKASNFLYDVTDGHLYFRYILIHDNKNNWDNADVQVHKGIAYKNSQSHWPQASVGGFDTGGEITMPQTYNPYGVSFIHYKPDQAEWYKTLIHECGHYIMHLYDEYQDADEKDYPIGLAPKTFMSNQLFYSSMSTPRLYNDWIKPFWMKTTEHKDETGQSCWETFFEKYSSRLWFDLDKNGVDDTTFLSSYYDISGPKIAVNGGFTIVDIYNS
ncbi:MAG: PKD domain-containing protein [Thermoplasmata archaeon]|nr:MAG: PKD domain-containing protein [Thermoplasmata archaeon]